jgi:hypothetical protein
MKNTGFKYVSLVIGLMAAVVIILSQCFSLKPVSSVDKNSSAFMTSSVSDQQDQSKGDTEPTSITISATSFPASAQVNFIQEAACLFEICFTEHADLQVNPVENVSLSKFFSTILQVIISPNAP